PSPSADDAARGLDVGPIVVAGGGVGHGTLSSDTTGRDGLVSNIDLAPSILGWFGVPVPPQMSGHAFTVHPAPFPLSSALADFRHFSRAARQSDAVLGAALGLWLVAIGLGTLAIERRLRALARSLAASATAPRRPGRRRGSRPPPDEA